MCRIGKKRGGCTTIVQGVVQDRKKEGRLHNYCARRCAGSGKRVPVAQLLCKALCRIREKSASCTTIVQGVVQDRKKERVLHNYCAKRCAGSEESARAAQLLCKALCRIGGKRGGCTTISCVRMTDPSLLKKCLVIAPMLILTVGGHLKISSSLIEQAELDVGVSLAGCRYVGGSVVLLLPEPVFLHPAETHCGLVLSQPYDLHSLRRLR